MWTGNRLTEQDLNEGFGVDMTAKENYSNPP